ncbi:MAG: EamA family transporter, partial [Novosphingobium sp.]
YRAELYVTSGIVAVLYALLMVPNALFSRLFLGTRISGRFVAGSAVALSGIALLLLHEYRLAPPEDAIWLGIALTVGGLLCSSAANVLQATELAKGQPVVPLIAWAMLFGTALNAVFAWAVSGPPVLDPRPQYLAGIAYLAIAGSVVAFPLYFSLIRHLGAGRAAYNGVAVPVVAMALSTLFEGYRWSALAAGGAILAMSGLLIALSGRKAENRR